MPYINMDWDNSNKDPNNPFQYFPSYCVDCPFFDIDFEVYRSFDKIEKIFFDCVHRDICYRVYKKVKQKLKNNANPYSVKKETSISESD